MRVTDVKPFEDTSVCTKCKDVAYLVGGVICISGDHRPVDAGQSDPGCDFMISGVIACIHQNGVSIHRCGECSSDRLIVGRRHRNVSVIIIDGDNAVCLCNVPPAMNGSVVWRNGNFSCPSA